MYFCLHEKHLHVYVYTYTIALVVISLITCTASTHRLIATRGSSRQYLQQMKTLVSCGIAYGSDWCSASPDIELLVLLLQAEKQVWTGINIHTYIHSVYVASIYVFVYTTTLLGSVLDIAILLWPHPDMYLPIDVRYSILLPHRNSKLSRFSPLFL